MSCPMGSMVNRLFSLLDQRILLFFFFTMVHNLFLFWAHLRLTSSFFFSAVQSLSIVCQHSISKASISFSQILSMSCIRLRIEIMKELKFWPDSFWYLLLFNGFPKSCVLFLARTLLVFLSFFGFGCYIGDLLFTNLSTINSYSAILIIQGLSHHPFSIYIENQKTQLTSLSVPLRPWERILALNCYVIIQVIICWY